MPDDDRTFIKLHDGMPEHPKVEGLSDAAFRVLVESWCWSSRQHADGRMPRASWQKRRTPKVRKELVDAGLMHDRGPDGIEMHDYLEHQRSAEQIAEASEKKKRAGAKGNHERWHVGPKGRPQPDCPLCADPPPNGPRPSRNGSQVRSQNGSQMGSHQTSDRDPDSSPDPEEFLRNSQTETDLAGQDLGGSSRKQRGRARTDPPRAQKPERRDSPCGLHPDDDRPCRRCRDRRLATEQANRDDHRAAVVASLPARRCPMCDADGWLHRVGSSLPVSPATRCDHETDHALQVARAEEAS